MGCIDYGPAADYYQNMEANDKAEMQRLQDELTAAVERAITYGGPDDDTLLQGSLAITELF